MGNQGSKPGPMGRPMGGPMGAPMGGPMGGPRAPRGPPGKENQPQGISAAVAEDINSLLRYLSCDMPNNFNDSIGEIGNPVFGHENRVQPRKMNDPMQSGVGTLYPNDMSEGRSGRNNYSQRGQEYPGDDSMRSGHGTHYPPEPSDGHGQYYQSQHEREFQSQMEYQRGPPHNDEAMRSHAGPDHRTREPIQNDYRGYGEGESMVLDVTQPVVENRRNAKNLPVGESRPAYNPDRSDHYDQYDNFPPADGRHRDSRPHPEEQYWHQEQGLEREQQQSRWQDHRRQPDRGQRAPRGESPPPRREESGAPRGEPRSAGRDRRPPNPNSPWDPTFAPPPAPPRPSALNNAQNNGQTHEGRGMNDGTQRRDMGPPPGDRGPVGHDSSRSHQGRGPPPPEQDPGFFAGVFDSSIFNIPSLTELLKGDQGPPGRHGPPPGGGQHGMAAQNGWQYPGSQQMPPQGQPDHQQWQQPHTQAQMNQGQSQQWQSQQNGGYWQGGQNQQWQQPQTQPQLKSQQWQQPNSQMHSQQQQQWQQPQQQHQQQQWHQGGQQQNWQQQRPVQTAPQVYPGTTGSVPHQSAGGQAASSLPGAVSLSGGVDRLEPEEVHRLVQSNACLLVDVRGDDRKVGTIAGSVHEQAIDNIPFPEKVPGLVQKWRSQPLVVFTCQYSAHRAPQCANWYREQADPHQRVAIMAGGFRGWEAKGLPVVGGGGDGRAADAYALQQGAQITGHRMH